MTEITKIKLEEDDFRCLVSGGVLIHKIPKYGKEIQIILSDIGFDRMEKAIDDVIEGKLITYSDLTKIF